LLSTRAPLPLHVSLFWAMEGAAAANMCILILDKGATTLAISKGAVAPATATTFPFAAEAAAGSCPQCDDLPAMDGPEVVEPPALAAVVAAIRP